MENRFAAIGIITLCILSLILGINISVKKANVQNIEAEKSQSSIQNLLAVGSDKIALITLEGEISAGQSGSFMGDVYSAEGVQKALKLAEKDPTVKGILLRINSPGGTVAMSQEIYNTVLKLRKEKPVVVSMADVAASGGYYIASAADRILASPGTLTGSIGVIFNTIEVTSLTDKIGVNSNVIKSGKFKDTGSMYKKMTADEKQLLQDVITQTYGQFLNAIRKGRIKRNDNYKVKKTFLTEKNLATYADGRIINGEQAVTLGFVDELGGLDEAHLAASEMAAERFNLRDKEIPLVSYNKPAGISNLLFGISESFTPAKGFDSLVPFSVKNSKKPLYMWE